MTGKAAGLKGALDAVATVDGESQPARLWDGFGPLLARELPFTVFKLTVYTAAQSTLFQLLPAARERPVASFLVTVFCGALAGAVRGIHISAGRRRRHGARDRQIRPRLEEGPGDGRRW